MCGCFCIGFIYFMLQGINDFNNVFSPKNFKKYISNIYPNLNDQQQFRLNKVNEFKDYLIA